MTAREVATSCAGIVFLCALGCATDDEAITNSDETYINSPETSADYVEQYGKVDSDLVGSWVSEISRNKDWEPKERIIGHYSDMGYAVEGMTEVYVLESDGSYVRTVTNTNYAGVGDVVKSIHWGKWKAVDGAIALTTKHTQLNAFGEQGYKMDVDDFNKRAVKEGISLIREFPTVFLLAADRETFVLKYTGPSYRDGLDIVFRKQP